MRGSTTGSGRPSRTSNFGTLRGRMMTMVLSNKRTRLGEHDRLQVQSVRRRHPASSAYSWHVRRLWEGAGVPPASYRRELASSPLSPPSHTARARSPARHMLECPLMVRRPVERLATPGADLLP